jgi:hypothetical protein
VIRHPVSAAALVRLIRAEKADWPERAAARTEEFRRLGRFEETSSIWSEVKAVYMTLQGGSKCVYCERKLEAIRFGRGEQDVEHFRPKSTVGDWKLPRSLRDAGVTLTPVARRGPGYHLLPYHLFNYSASCKPCNSNLKRDYFPIAGTYTFDKDDPKDLKKKEKAYLIYPIGSLDDKPEELIEFYGISPRPVAADGFKRHRALVTIEFFHLDDEARKNLFLERAILLVTLFPQLERAHGSGPAAEKAEAKRLVKAFQSRKVAHTNCARSFCRLYAADRAGAKALHDRAVAFVLSNS